MAINPLKVKAYPAPWRQGFMPIPNWNPNLLRSTKKVMCRGCQQGDMTWSWNFHQNKPMLIDKCGSCHQCPTPNTRDVFPGWCETCKAPELVLIRKSYGFELTESYGLPHTCEQDPMKVIQEMNTGKCRGCKASDLFWVQVNDKFTLVHSDGTKHTCAEFGQFAADWAEAKRMNYAIEKAWLKSIPDGTPCKKCKGIGHTEFLSKNKRTMLKFGSSEPILMYRPCKKCKRLGTFTVLKKKDYLKDLRKRYWPFKGGTHKWKQYDAP